MRKKIGQLVQAIMTLAGAINRVADHLEAIIRKSLNEPSPQAFQPFSKFPEVESLIIVMLSEGYTYQSISDETKRQWPDEPEKQISKSALSRIWKSRNPGLRKRYGIRK